MTCTLALAGLLAAAPAQQSKLSLGNVRLTYGELGATRPDNRLLPGDVFFIGFDIRNIAVGGGGKVSFSMGLDVTDSKGKNIYRQKPIERKRLLPLGGKTLPARVYLTVPLDQDPGEYICKVTVKDIRGKSEASLTQKLVILPKRFGIVSVFTAGDPEGNVPAPTTGFVGQALWVFFNVVAFERGEKTNQPDLTVEISASGGTGMPDGLKIPLKRKLPEADRAMPFRFLVPMNRAGDFKLTFKATDNLSGKTSTVTLPVTVKPVSP